MTTTGAPAAGSAGTKPGLPTHWPSFDLFSGPGAIAPGPFLLFCLATAQWRIRSAETVDRPRQEGSTGTNFASINCTNLEMHSLFMLVLRSKASERIDSWTLFGSRIVMTRVGSSPSSDVEFT
jgi:hypothetical protein